MYPYITPHGYGDTFFIYAMNGEDLGILNGESYSLLNLTINDGDFICRVWSGVMRLLGMAIRRSKKD